MKTILVMIGVLLGLQLSTPTEWAQVYKSDQIVAEVEHALYERDNSTKFFIRVRVTNLTSSPLGVELRDRRTVLYPNQWGDLDTDRRQIIDELLAPPRQLDDAWRRELIDAYRSGKLQTIPARGTLDYFADFNYPGSRSAVDRATRRFIVLSIKGQLVVTNGTEVWNNTMRNFSNVDVGVPRPFEWKKIPVDAIVVSYP